jgi:Tfp pilus assembly PilM family ATPase
MEKAANEMFEEVGFSAKRGLVAAPGFQVLSKPIRLPAIDKTKVAQLIKFEAKQNIPFPLEEAAWDHYTMGMTKSGEVEVLLSALKSEVADGMIKLAKAQGVNVELVDTAQGAGAHVNCQKGFRTHFISIDWTSNHAHPFNNSRPRQQFHFQKSGRCC